MKSLPWSVEKVSGMPQMCQCGSGLRPIAWRRASAVWSADGAVRFRLYPATARL